MRTPWTLRIVSCATLVIAMLLLSQGSALAARGACITASVSEAVRLPDGSIHETDTISFCLTRDYSPVQSLHVTYIDHLAVGNFISRRGLSEGPAETHPYVMFSREADGVLSLRGYAVPGQGQMETFSMEWRRQVPREPLILIAAVTQ